MSRTFQVPDHPAAGAEVPDHSERSGPLYLVLVLFAVLGFVWMGVLWASSWERGPHYTYYSKGRQQTGSRASDRLYVEWILGGLACAAAAPTLLWTARLFGVAPGRLKESERFREKSVHRGEQLTTEERIRGVTFEHPMPLHGDPANTGCMQLGCGCVFFALAGIHWYEDYLGAAELAAALGFFFGMIPVLAGLYANWGQAHVEEMDVTTPAESWPRGHDIPLRIRVLAARDMWVDAVQVELWQLDSRFRLYHHKGWKVHWTTDWTERGTFRIPVDCQIRRGQELILVDRLPLGIGLAPSSSFPHTAVQVDDLRAQTLGETVDWYLATAVEIDRVPDAFFGWRFVKLTEEGDLPGSITEEALTWAIQTAGEGVRCPFCGDPFQGSEAIACRDCDTVHHEDCWRTAGRCTTYACEGTRHRSVRLVQGRGRS